MQMNEKDRVIDLAADKSYGLLNSCGGNPLLLEEPYKSFVIVSTIQAIMDNGGVSYFLESPLEHGISYDMVKGAYAEVGLPEEAELICKINKLVLTIGVDRIDSCELKTWDDFFCGDEKVWDRLYSYVIENEFFFRS